MTNLSFVIHFHTRRLDNLLQTLDFLGINHADVVKKSELILICQDQCEPIQTPNFAKVTQVCMELPFMQLPRLTNEGVMRATADRVVVLESDRILPEGYFEQVLAELKPGISITTKKMRKLTAAASNDEIVAGKYDTTCDDRSTTCEFGVKNMWSGNTAFMKADFLRVGKMDETYTGYGWADCDMTLTMEHGGVQSIYKENHTELHLWHEGQTYGSGDQKQMYFDNCIYCCKKWNRPLPKFVRDEMLKHGKGFL